MQCIEPLNYLEYARHVYSFTDAETAKSRGMNTAHSSTLSEAFIQNA